MRCNDVEREIAGMVMVGFGGTTLSPFLESAVADAGVGGVILLARNVESDEQVTSLCREIAELSPLTPPLLAVDQEGGRVSRVGKGLAVLPGNMALGAARSPALARRAGRLTALQIASLGMNLNLAPVLDVLSTPRNRVISTRSFGGDPRLVGELGAAWLEGAREGGVLSAAKHFPGLGRARDDPHYEATAIRASLEELEEKDVRPFRDVLPCRPDFVMMSHASYHSIEAVPATLSGRAIRRLLRRELGYGGAVISDDLCMKAVSGSMSVGDAAVRFIAGGGDMILVCEGEETLAGVIRAVRAAVKRGVVSREAVRRAAKRIEGARRRARRPAGDFRLSDLQSLSLEIARASVTAAGLPRGALSLAGEALEKVLVVETRYPGRGDGHSRLAELMRARGIEAESRLVEIVPSEEEIGEASEAASRALSSVILTYDCFHYAQQLRLIAGVAGRCGSVVCVAGNSPYDIARLSGVAPVLATYSASDSSMIAAVEVLLGERTAAGVVPVSLEGV